MNFKVSNSAGRSVEEMARLFNSGFAGYFVPVNMNAETFADFARSGQIDLARSVVAYGPEDAPGGVGVLGMRGKRGWIGGFGVSSDFRGTGLARQMLDKLIEEARNNSLTSLRLEVLRPNERARKLYLGAGFKVQRELVIYEAAASSIKEAVPANITLAEIRELEPGIALAAMGMPEQNREFPPCWQRETPGILGQRGARALLGRLESGERGLVIFTSVTARRRAALLHIGFDTAISEETRTTLLGGLLNAIEAEYGPASTDSPASSFSILNEPEGSSLSVILEKLGFKETWQQSEMLLELQESGT